MQPWLPWLLFLALAAFGGCSLAGEEASAPAYLEVHLMGWFDQTPVRVELDGQVLLAGRVSTGTGFSSGYAAILPVPLEGGTHTLRIAVADAALAETTLVVPDTLYLGIHYDPATRTVGFTAQKQPFGYL